MDEQIIKSPCRFRKIDQETFIEVDYVVMGAAFELQNCFGRLFDEIPYQSELAKRLSKKFECIEMEVPLIATYKDFEKPYFLDLVINQSVIYELKAVKAIRPAHKSQLLNYLMLTNLSHGKLVNFGAYKVESEFVSTTLTVAERRRLSFDDTRFAPIDERSICLRNVLGELLDHFGGFLDTSLFYQAIYHFFGGKDSIIGTVDLVTDGPLAVAQRVHLISPHTAFKLTSFKRDLDEYRLQLQKFVRNTDLKSIHWFNLHGRQITVETICA